MQNDVFYSIGKIIERDSKSTTYKFALLRGVIDMIQDHSPYTTIKADRVSFPMGLLIEKRKDQILTYWEILNESQSTRFKKEIQVALLGNHPFATWQQTGIQQLQESCQYLISNRGYEEWRS